MDAAHPSAAGTGESTVPEASHRVLDSTAKQRLVAAAQQGRADEVEVLLAQVAAGILLPASLPNAHMRVALRLAALNDHAHVVQGMLRAKAPAEQRKLMAPVTEMHDLQGWSALDVAVLAGSLESVRVLLAHKADVRTSHVPSWDSGPLCTAARTWWYNAEVVDALLEAGSTHNDEALDHAFTFAVKANRPCMVRALLRRQDWSPHWRHFELAAEYAGADMVANMYSRLRIRPVAPMRFQQALRKAVQRNTNPDAAAAVVRAAQMLGTQMDVVGSERTRADAEVVTLVTRALQDAVQVGTGGTVSMDVLRTLTAAKAQPLQTPLKSTIPADNPEVTEFLVQHARAFGTARAREEDPVDALSRAAEQGCSRVAAWIVAFYGVDPDDAVPVAQVAACDGRADAAVAIVRAAVKSPQKCDRVLRSLNAGGSAAMAKRRR